MQKPHLRLHRGAASRDWRPWRMCTRAETQVAQSQLNLTRSSGELEKSRGQLASVVGLAVNASIAVQPLQQPPQIKEMTTGISELLEKAKASRPDLVAAEAQVRAAEGKRQGSGARRTAID